MYQWKLDDAFAPLSDQSGYVRSVITFVGDLLNKSQPLEVIASSFDKKVSAYGKQVVAQQEPRIIFYEKHPLYGVRYERALTDDTVVSGGEMSIVAEPFYFSTPTRNRSVSYKWEVDGDAIAGSEVAGSTITVRGTGASGVLIFQFPRRNRVLFSSARRTGQPAYGGVAGIPAGHSSVRLGNNI